MNEIISTNEISIKPDKVIINISEGVSLVFETSEITIMDIVIAWSNLKNICNSLPNIYL